jgi:HAMP domain-containing protein
VKPPRRSVLGRFLRLYLWLLLAALLIGFGIGLVIRERLERPQIYMGAVARTVSVAAAPIPAPSRPNAGSRGGRG